MDEGLTGGEDGFIVVRGARAHNLRDVSVRFPRGRMTVVTGVSGSGKSSLAFDTVFAEGQRRYLESLPPHARQFLDRLERPDVDYVGGLAPAIAIGRPTAAAGPRSTLATVSELHDHLRLLFAHLGTAHCPSCGRVVRAVSPGALAERLLREPEGTRLTLLSPMLRRPPRGVSNAENEKPRRAAAALSAWLRSSAHRSRACGGTNPKCLSPLSANRRAAASATALLSQNTLAHRSDAAAGGSTFTNSAARHPRRSIRPTVRSSLEPMMMPSGFHAQRSAGGRHVLPPSNSSTLTFGWMAA